MASANTSAQRAPVFNHEGVRAVHNPTSFSELQRSVLCALLSEYSYYGSGGAHTQHVKNLIRHCKPADVAALAVEARTAMHLRHIPLLLVSEIDRAGGNGPLVARTLPLIIQRPDELTEYLAVLWAGRAADDKKRPKLSHGAHRGLRAAFTKFTPYSLAKYRDDDKVIKLRDVLRLVRPKPVSEAQVAAFKALRAGTLRSEDTWEVELSAGKDKKATFERLLAEGKLGGLATLRNLRKMLEVRVDSDVIRARLRGTFDRVLPFRFLSAARYAPSLAAELSEAMLRACADQPKLPGTTIILVDVSPSMRVAVSEKSEVTRMDAGCGLAVLLREIGDHVRVFAFAQQTKEVQSHRGLPLVEAVQRAVPSNGTWLGAAVKHVNSIPHDRLIVVTDEESQDEVGAASADRAYMINLSTSSHGVGFGPWVRITGWSERIVDFIREYEGVEGVGRVKGVEGHTAESVEP